MIRLNATGDIDDDWSLEERNIYGCYKGLFFVSHGRKCRTYLLRFATLRYNILKWLQQNNNTSAKTSTYNVCSQHKQIESADIVNIDGRGKVVKCRRTHRILFQKEKENQPSSYCWVCNKRIDLKIGLTWRREGRMKELLMKSNVSVMYVILCYSIMRYIHFYRRIGWLILEWGIMLCRCNHMTACLWQSGLGRYTVHITNLLTNLTLVTTEQR